MTRKRSTHVIVNRSLVCERPHVSPVEAILMASFGSSQRQLCGDCAYETLAAGVALSQCLLVGTESLMQVEAVLREVDSLLGLSAVPEPAGGLVWEADMAGEVPCVVSGEPAAGAWGWSPTNAGEQATCNWCGSSTADFIALRRGPDGGQHGGCAECAAEADQFVNSRSWAPEAARLGCCRDCAKDITAYLHEFKIALFKAQALAAVVANIERETVWAAECMAKYGFIVVRHW